VKTSDLINNTGQVPDFGEVGQVAPQLFEANAGAMVGPIDTGRTGVVVKMIDKQQPTPGEIAKNFDRTRDQLLDERRQEAFSVFMSGLWNDYKKHGRIRFNAKAQQTPGL
jgi:peptidyl-prolyl cis-trans isomerase D